MLHEYVKTVDLAMAKACERNLSSASTEVWVVYEHWAELVSQLRGFSSSALLSEGV
jgi:hypothetical protein